MADGLYQSVVIFFVAYLLFRSGIFVTANGQGLDDRERFGTFIAPAAIFVINTYILLNTYRWDWLMALLVVISILLVWTWTGIYSSFVSADYFYKAAAQVFGEATFWAVTGLSIVISLLPRFLVKFVQKVYRPYDVDIIREQVRQGKFDYLDNPKDSEEDSFSNDSSTSSDPAPSKHHLYPIDDDQRPIYPPSVAQTNTTHNQHSQNGSDGTDFTGHRRSAENQLAVRQSVDRARPSFDRMRQSCVCT